MVRNVLVRILAHEQYEVLEACSASEALKISSSFGGTINLLIADERLETMTGRQLAELIVESRPKIRVLQTSACALESLEQEGGLMPGAGFVQKPFLWRNLITDVKGILDQPKKAAASEGQSRTSRG
jgi:two-component system, cell cycle sensor histidine kinase and response regulator CckA